MWLAAMFALAHPRRVGDASEYVAMAGRLASGKAPAMTADEMAAFTREWAGWSAGYELQTRQLAPLRGHDGRYDMPHPWVYSLLAVPGVWLARGVGLADPWGLVAFNLVLVLQLLWLAARRGAGPWSLTLLGGPLVWWIDKPVSDLFMACVVGSAVLVWPHPASIALLGLAAGQNPALGLVAAVFTLAAVVAEPRRLRSWSWIGGVMLGLACAGLPAAYYLVRLGRISPLSVWIGTVAWPPFGSLVFPLLDLNLGFVFRFLPGAVAVALALCNPRGWRAPGAIPGAVGIALLLLVVSQQPNHNHGGNPDFSRYWLWTWPLALPWLLAQDASPRRSVRVTGLVLLAAAAAWSTIAFRPTRDESYRYPTRLAAWVWRTHPRWSSPSPEAFAERTSHREPGWVPTATPGCEKVLLYGGTWPASCPPISDAPEACRAAGLYCYANARADGSYAFTMAGRPRVPDIVVHDRTWDRADDVSAWVARRVSGAASGERDNAVANVRGAWHVAWRQAWTDHDGRLVLYARDVGFDARLAMRHAGPVQITVATPEGQVDQRRGVPAAAPTTVALPPGPHVLVVVRSEDGRP
jgi:hypothetical protein